MQKNNLLRIVLIACLGNVFEWYDFMIYAALTPVLSMLFFPSHDPLSSLIYTFGTFAAGFLARPFGAVLFGFIGDRFGRRKALLYSIGLMVTPTFLIGCLPTFQHIGIWAPICLLILRVFQGLAMSGEMAGNIVFLVEIAPQKWRTTLSSLAVVGILLGVLIASNSVLGLTHVFGQKALNEWMWRIPFWFAAFLSVLVLILRRSLPETALFLSEKKRPRHPIAMCIKDHWRSLLIGIGCLSSYSCLFYFLMVFALTYFQQMLSIPLEKALMFSILIQVITVFILPIGGWLGDRFGRRKVSIISTALLLAFSYPGILMLADVPHFTPMLFGAVLVIFSVLYAIAAGNIPALESALLPTEVRYTGVSLIHNIAMTLFGGVVPILMTLLVKHTGSLSSPSWLLILCSAISLVCFWIMPKPEF